ncbi:MAG: 50S ribosomal protein L19 [Dehalococcoidales bacterium]|nr:50S ribosomal protein L19 [Dehalococcoidales bacterium]
MNITDILEVKVNPNIPALAPGDTVRVRQKVVEGEKTRIQVFQGVVIRIHRAAAGTNFTVRRVTSGVGVERTFPIYSPMIDGVEIVRHGKVRRAKLYYLRGLSARASRIKERRVEKLGDEVKAPEPEPEVEEAQPLAEAPVAQETAKTEAAADQTPAVAEAMEPKTAETPVEENKEETK